MDGRFDPHSTWSTFPASRALERIVYEIKRVIQRECVVRDSQCVEWIVPLLSRLRALAPYPIVSLNYDNVIELGCERAKVRFNERVLGEPTDGCAIELVKLHGSVTWAPARAASLTRTRQPSSAIVRRLGEMRSPILETPLIYPSRRKMPIYNPFIRNALRFQELLADRRYTTCIVVGYRFPDAHVRSWLAEALRARPELRVCLVSPHPENNGEALDNLTKNLPAVPWTERLHLIKMKFADTITYGFERALREATPYGPGIGYREDPGRSGTAAYCYTGTTSGLGASRDGETLFLANPATRRIMKVNLNTNRCAAFTRPCKDPRGIAVAADGRVLVVENALIRLGPITVHGVGTVRAFRPDGRRGPTLTPLRVRDLIKAALRIMKGTATTSIWSDIPSVLRWPTDVVTLADGTIYATEARALTKIPAKGGMPQQVCAPELVFNLHGLDVASDGALVGVEEGVAQDTGWGRVLRFERGPHGVRDTRSAAVDGQPRLMAIAFVTSIGKVVVTQSLTWPHGRIIVLDYPALDDARFVAGFDLPGKIEYIPRRELLAVATRGRVQLVPVSELQRAKPLEARPVR